MAGSNSNRKPNRNHSRSCINRQLGFSIRRPGTNHDWSRTPIRISAFWPVIKSHRLPTLPHNELPPQSNGIIERWHRTLKAAIRCQQTESWAEALPMILLGLRAVYKEDIESSPAEMVFGQTLRLPGEMIDAKSSTKTTNEHEFITSFRQRMQQLEPTTTPLERQSFRTKVTPELHSRFHSNRRCEAATNCTVRRTISSGQTR